MDLQRLYFAMPTSVQEWALSLYAQRLDRLYYGEEYPRWLASYQALEQETPDEQLARQIAVLQRILTVAERHIAWWRMKVQQMGLQAKGCRSLDDLRHWPVMEKDPIRQNPGAFVHEEYPKKLLWLEKTSGTTGKSLQIYWPREMLPRWWALHEVRVRHWAGVGQSLPRAMVGGRPVIPGDTTEPPFWRYNRYWQQLYLSSYHISPETAPAYIEAMHHYGSQWITGYGSAIALLGEYLCEHTRETEIIAAVTSGDTVSPRQRRAIEDGFRCRMFDYYGSAEGCCVISECAYGRMHVQPEAGILEIIDEQGDPCPPGVEGEFICTGLLNDVMPLIRYRTGDYGAWAMDARCPCGRQSRLVSHITGRTDDYLVLPDGRQVGRLSTAMKKAPSVKQAQLAQDAPDHAWLLVVPDDHYRDTDGATVVADIYSRIGGKAIRIEVCPVEEIPPTRVGKHVLVRRLLDDTEAQMAYRDLIARGYQREVTA